MDEQSDFVIVNDQGIPIFEGTNVSIGRVDGGKYDVFIKGVRHVVHKGEDMLIYISPTKNSAAEPNLEIKNKYFKRKER